MPLDKETKQLFKKKNVIDALFVLIKSINQYTHIYACLWSKNDTS